MIIFISIDGLKGLVFATLTLSFAHTEQEIEMKAAASSVTATVDDTLKLGCTANAKPTVKEVYQSMIFLNLELLLVRFLFAPWAYYKYLKA